QLPLVPRDARMGQTRALQECSTTLEPFEVPGSSAPHIFLWRWRGSQRDCRRGTYQASTAGHTTEKTHTAGARGCAGDRRGRPAELYDHLVPRHTGGWSGAPTLHALPHRDDTAIRAEIDAAPQIT